MLTSTTSKIMNEYADDAATMNGWSDRTPATIVKRTPKMITVQEDAHFIAPAGPAVPPMDIYERDYDSPLRVYTLRKNGRWIAQGAPANTRGASLTVGRRNFYRDPSF